jgi:hypothetical protein
MFKSLKKKKSEYNREKVASSLIHFVDNSLSLAFAFNITCLCWLLFVELLSCCKYIVQCLAC